MNYPAPETIGLSSTRLERAYQFLDDAVRRGQIPGAAILVARQGTPVAPRAFGRLRLSPDSPPMQPDSIFLTASVTKPVVVSALMLLVERGLILLDDPACAYVPEFADFHKDGITIRHLMTHTSGLPDMLPENEGLRAQHAPLSEFVRRICELSADFSPGTDIQYQSTGIAMLGEILERVTATPLRDFLRREIFDPLGMDDTALGAAGLPAQRIAEVNVWPEMAEKDWNWNNPYWQNFGAPWGGLFSTVGDMFRYCQLFLNGGNFGDVHIFSPATVAAMTRNQTRSLPDIDKRAEHEHAWGLGWRLIPPSGRSTYGNPVSPGTFGHSGSTGTLVWMDPEREMVCVLFTTQPADTLNGLRQRCSNLVAASAEG
jgi:CubicO group peptidase (beta-lactamase class C family)